MRAFDFVLMPLSSGGFNLIVSCSGQYQFDGEGYAVFRQATIEEIRDCEAVNCFLAYLFRLTGEEKNEN